LDSSTGTAVVKQELYWIIHHEELFWSPGQLLPPNNKVSEEQMLVECINQIDDYYTIDKPGVRVLPLTTQFREDLCDLYNALTPEQLKEVDKEPIDQSQDSLEVCLKQSFEASMMQTLR